MTLTDAQNHAIAAPEPLLQIVACAGSGKTEVLARRVVARLTEGVPPEGIVAFTFTEKAAEELRDRIEQRAAEADGRYSGLPPCSAGLFVGTIHGFCLNALERSGGVYELFDPLPDDREWTLLHRFGRRLGLVDLMTQTWPDEHISVRRAVDLFARSLAVIHNERVPRDALETRVPVFAQAVRRYEDLLRDMQLLSFDQMIELACREMATGGHLHAAFKGKLREVFVDEYQDLNGAQEELLHRMVEMGARLTSVGDDDQAIYQWRGGNVSIFIDFEKRFPRAARQTLTENHRSVEPVVSVTGSFIQTVAERVAKDIHSARAENGPAIELAQAETPQAEAEFVAQRIKKLLEAGHQPADVAVLYRSVRSSAKPLIEALRNAGIPAGVVGKLSLLDRPETALVARVLVWWAGGTWMPDDEREVITAEQLAADLTALTGISQTEAARVIADAEQVGKRLAEDDVPDLISVYMNLLNQLGLPADGPERRRQENGLGQFSALLAEFEHAQRRAAPATWYSQMTPTAAEEVAEDTALLREATPSPPATVQVGHPRGEIFLGRLRVFLEEFASAAIEEASERATLEQDAVNIMTIHQSKGLEFPIVFVPCLVERRFPSSRMGREQPWYVPDDLFDKTRYQGREDDERRLLYVAMTRAREMLVLSWFGQYQGGQRAARSRFVEDLVRVAPRQHLKGAGQCRPVFRPRRSTGRPILETSFSELYTFNECPRKYYYRSVCGFQPSLVPELGFGKLLHHLVAELARRAIEGNSVDVRDVKEMLARASYLPFAGHIARDRLFKAALLRVEGYVRHHGAELQRALAPEWPFEVLLGAARIAGRVDLVLRTAGGGRQDVEFVDFKTAANRPPSKHHKNQLRLYAEAARILGWNPVQLSIHDLDADNGGRIAIENDASAASAFRAELHSWVERIVAGDFEHPRSRAGCNACDFARLCSRG